VGRDDRPRPYLQNLWRRALVEPAPRQGWDQGGNGKAAIQAEEGEQMNRIAKAAVLVVYIAGWSAATGPLYLAANPKYSETARVACAVTCGAFWPVLYVFSRVHEQMTPSPVIPLYPKASR
jgi:hypothetical protein